MAELEIPFPLKGLPLKPELVGKVKVDDVLIQTLSALLGYDGEGRRLLKCALSGSLYAVSPPVFCVVNKEAIGDAESITFGSIPTTEVLVMANANNSGDVWVNTGCPAAVDTGWPLAAGDWLKVSLNNLSVLRLYVVTSGDKVIILRTV